MNATRTLLLSTIEKLPMRIILIVLFALTTMTASAQIKTEWVGGTPGKETNWSEPRNWSTNDVPDNLSCVVIKLKNSGHNAQPVLEEEVRIVSLEVQSGAQLIITKKGHLVIDGTNTFSQGLQVFGGRIENKGKISLKNIDKKYLKRNFRTPGITIINDDISSVVIHY